MTGSASSHDPKTDAFVVTVTNSIALKRVEEQLSPARSIRVHAALSDRESGKAVKFLIRSKKRRTLSYLRRALGEAAVVEYCRDFQLAADRALRNGAIECNSLVFEECEGRHNADSALGAALQASNSEPTASCRQRLKAMKGTVSTARIDASPAADDPNSASESRSAQCTQPTLTSADILSAEVSGQDAHAKKPRVQQPREMAASISTTATAASTPSSQTQQEGRNISGVSGISEPELSLIAPTDLDPACFTNNGVGLSVEPHNESRLAGGIPEWYRMMCLGRKNDLKRQICSLNEQRVMLQRVHVLLQQQHDQLEQQHDWLKQQQHSLERELHWLEQEFIV